MNFTAPVNRQVKKPSFVTEWKGILKRARLDFTTKAIAMFVADYADYQTGEDVYPGIARLVVETGASHSTVERALAKLRKLGLIRMTKRGNRRMGLSDEYALAVPEDLLDRVEVRDPEAMKKEIALEADRKASPLTVRGDEPDYPSQGGVNEPITPHCEGPPTRNPYLPDKSDHPDELALGPELPTAREETPVNPEEIDEMQRQGVPGPERARRALAAANRPFERKGVVDLPAPPLPPVPADNGLRRLIEAAEEWGKE